MSNPPTPIRHGDWHVINGELVDVSQAPPATPIVASAAPAKPINTAPSQNGARDRPKKR